MSNRVLCIQNLNGDNCSTAQAIEEAFVEYYVQLLGTSKAVTPVHVPTVRKGTVLTAEKCQALVQEVNSEEIKQALSSIPANKAPGPDGYTSQFFKDAADIVGEDLVAAVKEFFQSGKLLTQVNSTVLTLVPKKARPISVADFRPIACCNVVYKVISKVICNRLVPILPHIVSVTQSAFIKGRDIVDNILICHDLVRLYNRKAYSPRCIMKVNLKKAYDSIEWQFNEQMLRALGFPDRMVNWIMVCVSSPWFSLSLNGNTFGGDRRSITIILRSFATFSGASGYLGVPISYKRLAIGDCSRIFVIPTTVIERIESIYRTYLWSGGEHYCRAPAVSWDKVSKAKKNGGLGIINCRLWNEAMIDKYVWWLASKDDHLWIRWVSHIYMKGQNWMDYKPTCNTSWTWRRICHVKEIMKPSYTNSVYTGSSGYYSASQGYKWLQGEQVKCDWFPLIWNKSNIPKHSFVGWLAVQGRLFTKDRMQAFGLPTNGLCEFCLAGPENHQHLLYQCIYSKKCWDSLMVWLRVTVPVQDVVQWSVRWRSRSLLKKQVVLTAIIALWYHLWHARNVCRLEAKLFTPSFVVKQVKSEVQQRCRQKLSTSKYQLPEFLTGMQAS
ncbi:uncharacterized protein LOC141651701 [Silene latifolia]|uniref:uncharacterized protein LOC141651701 n=1 Tax=Silene latifolia TaxID=37657 RepID=UPI003D771A63